MTLKFDSASELELQSAKVNSIDEPIIRSCTHYWSECDSTVSWPPKTPSENLDEQQIFILSSIRTALNFVEQPQRWRSLSG